MKKNLLIMLYLWVATSVSYYITSFNVKYLNGNMFYNSIAMASSECLSLFLAGYIFLKFGLKKAVLSAYICGIVGSVMILFFKSYSSIMPLFVLIARFGIGSVFGLIYLGNLIFPVKYASQTLGLCNTAARLFTVMSPVIAELDHPTPMLIFIVLSASAGILSTQLNISRK